ncbi:MAG: hypothetical protein FWC22_06570 [Treponema sp.]|nr:hypothetical protein [Treponema sp.]
MSRRIFLLALISLFVSISVFAFDEDEEEAASIPQSISNNIYYQQSLHYTRLAYETYESGDYEASAGFAQEAVRFTQLSDQYVSSQLISEAERLKNLAEKNNIIEKFPNNYNEGLYQYETAVVAHSNDSWEESITAAINAIEIFGVFEATGVPGTARPGTSSGTAAGTSGSGTSGSDGATGSGRQYTVRTWVVERDCFWNIAGYPWVYGDPWQWRVLYEANKSKLPDPNNPDLIEPGMILDIPDLTNENRQGMWRP